MTASILANSFPAQQQLGKSAEDLPLFGVNRSSVATPTPKDSFNVNTQKTHGTTTTETTNVRLSSSGVHSRGSTPTEDRPGSRLLFNNAMSTSILTDTNGTTSYNKSSSAGTAGKDFTSHRSTSRDPSPIRLTRYESSSDVLKKFSTKWDKDRQEGAGSGAELNTSSGGQRRTSSEALAKNRFDDELDELQTDNEHLKSRLEEQENKMDERTAALNKLIEEGRNRLDRLTKENAELRLRAETEALKAQRLEEQVRGVEKNLAASQADNAHLKEQLLRASIQLATSTPAPSPARRDYGTETTTMVHFGSISGIGSFQQNRVGPATFPYQDFNRISAPGPDPQSLMSMSDASSMLPMSFLPQQPKLFDQQSITYPGHSYPLAGGVPGAVHSQPQDPSARYMFNASCRPSGEDLWKGGPRYSAGGYVLENSLPVGSTTTTNTTTTQPRETLRTRFLLERPASADEDIFRGSRSLPNSSSHNFQMPTQDPYRGGLMSRSTLVDQSDYAHHPHQQQLQSYYTDSTATAGGQFGGYSSDTGYMNDSRCAQPALSKFPQRRRRTERHNTADLSDFQDHLTDMGPTKLGGGESTADSNYLGRSRSSSGDAVLSSAGNMTSSATKPPILRNFRADAFTRNTTKPPDQAGYPASRPDPSWANKPPIASRPSPLQTRSDVQDLHSDGGKSDPKVAAYLMGRKLPTGGAAMGTDMPTMSTANSEVGLLPRPNSVDSSLRSSYRPRSPDRSMTTADGLRDGQRQHGNVKPTSDTTVHEWTPERDAELKERVQRLLQRTAQATFAPPAPESRRSTGGPSKGDTSTKLGSKYRSQARIEDLQERQSEEETEDAFAYSYNQTYPRPSKGGYSGTRSSGLSSAGGGGQKSYPGRGDEMNRNSIEKSAAGDSRAMNGQLSSGVRSGGDAGGVPPLDLDYLRSRGHGRFTTDLDDY